MLSSRSLQSMIRNKMSDATWMARDCLNEQIFSILMGLPGMIEGRKFQRAGDVATAIVIESYGLFHGSWTKRWRQALFSMWWWPREQLYTKEKETGLVLKHAKTVSMQEREWFFSAEVNRKSFSKKGKSWTNSWIPYMGMGWREGEIPGSEKNMGKDFEVFVQKITCGW